jgi:hypothetical protein
MLYQKRGYETKQVDGAIALHGMHVHSMGFAMKIGMVGPGSPGTLRRENRDPSEFHWWKRDQNYEIEYGVHSLCTYLYPESFIMAPFVGSLDR